MESAQEIKLSFIVPVYGVEKYLRKCVDSLLCQDYDCYEIILVDDGGRDGCPAICDEYAAKYDKISVIHRENGGLSAARNSGIAAARGEYVCFVDSDDYFSENVLGGLMEQIEREDLDVLRYDYRIINEKGQAFWPAREPKRLDSGTAVVDGTTYLETRFAPQCYAWQFIVRTDIARKEPFCEGIYFEDTEWTPRMFWAASRVNMSPIVAYNYLWRTGTISRNVDRQKKIKTINDLLAIAEGHVMNLVNHPGSTWLRGTIMTLVRNALFNVAQFDKENQWHHVKRAAKIIEAQNAYRLYFGARIRIAFSAFINVIRRR